MVWHTTLMQAWALHGPWDCGGIASSAWNAGDGAYSWRALVITVWRPVHITDWGGVSWAVHINYPGGRDLLTAVWCVACAHTGGLLPVVGWPRAYLHM